MADTTEKITINLSIVDLGKIDLLVETGHYMNRTDFIKDAIRRSLDTYEPMVREKVARGQYALGLLHFDTESFEKARNEGLSWDLMVVGVLSISADVPPALVQEVVRSCKVYGAIRASDEVKAVLKGKTSERR